MTVTDEVITVKWNSDKIVTAEVDGYWVCWTRRSGSWECSCGDVACIHVAAVRQVTGR